MNLFNLSFKGSGPYQDHSLHIFNVLLNESLAIYTGTGDISYLSSPLASQSNIAISVVLHMNAFQSNLSLHSGILKPISSLLEITEP